MELQKTNKKADLLSNYCKKIGIAVILLALIPAVIVKAKNIQLTPANKELYSLLTMNAIILGVFFIAWAKDKVEDEMTIALRLKAMSWSFSTAIFVVITKPIADLFVHDPIIDIKGQQLVLSMLFGYLIMFFILKRNR